jgi:hypothetical protein
VSPRTLGFAPDGGTDPPHGKERGKSSEGWSAANLFQRINRW